MSCGKRARHGSDGRLHVLRGAIEIAIEIELQGDLRAAQDSWDTIESMPAMVDNCCSSGVATDEAMVSGLAPGSCADTGDRRMSTWEESLTRSDL